MWNPVQHYEVELKGTIDAKQVENLKAYLTPLQYIKEKEGGKESSQIKAYRERIKNWRQEYKEKIEDASDEDEEEEEGLGEDDDLDLGVDDEGGKDKENDSDEEFKADEDFINAADIIVQHSDLE